MTGPFSKFLGKFFLMTAAALFVACGDDSSVPAPRIQKAAPLKSRVRRRTFFQVVRHRLPSLRRARGRLPFRVLAMTERTLPRFMLQTPPKSPTRSSLSTGRFLIRTRALRCRPAVHGLLFRSSNTDLTVP